MNIKDVLSSLRIDYKSAHEHEHVRDGWAGIDCHLCSQDWRHFRLGINLKGLYAHCWVCGKVNLVEALSAASGQTYRQIKQLLEGVERAYEVFDKVKGIYKPPQGIGPLAEAHKRYLQNRGFDPVELTTLWGIGGIGLHERLAWRLFIPILHDGKPSSWTTRTIQKGNGLRYISAGVEEESISRKALLYGEEKAGQTIFVVEGPADVWAIGRGAVATLGAAYSRAQVSRLSTYPTRVIVFDSEKAAQESAKRLCDLLSVFPGKTYRVELDAKDPGSADKKEIKRLRKAFL